MALQPVNERFTGLFYNVKMSVWALGINHTTAPLDVRGRFAFALDQLSPTLTGLRTALQSKTGSGEPELTLVSTCNRTEIYGVSNTVQSHDALHWLAASGEQRKLVFKAGIQGSIQGSNGRSPMRLTLYYHPLASYCHKVLIALYKNKKNLIWRFRVIHI